MKLIIISIILAVPLLATAAPGVAELLQQFQPSRVPLKPKVPPGFTIEKGDMPILQQTTPFLVKNIKITGNKKVSTRILHALIAEAEGRTLTLAQLYEYISKITDYYVKNGVPLARAIVPAQVISNGNVTIQVIVARYDSVKLENNSHSSDAMIAATLSPLKAGDDIEQPALNRALLLVSDLPGVRTTSTLTAGMAAGTSELVVFTDSAPRVAGKVLLDNSGGESVGENRAGASITILDPFGLNISDQVTATILSSGSNMNYGRVAYEAVVSGSGTRVGASVLALKYELGGATAKADSTGTVAGASVFVRQPIIRTVDANISVQAQADTLNLNDKVGLIHTDRGVRDVSLSLIADSTDSALGGGRNSANLMLTFGKVKFTDAEAQAADAAGARTVGIFSKLNASIARTQVLSQTSEILLFATAQLANKNLDSSQKMTLGGANSIRGFESGIVSGDRGYALTAEYRKNFGVIANGLVTGLAFVDTGTISLNKKVLNTTSSDSITLSSFGLGLHWTGPNGWNAKTHLATPVGEINPTLNEKKSLRGWVEVSNNF